MKNILIVEDNAMLRGLLRDWLTAEIPECRILEAVSGEEALKRAGEGLISIGVMDIGLRGMNGIDTARRLRALQPGFRFITMSIHEEERYIREAREAGAAAYVPKNMIQQRLLPEIRALLAADKVPADAPSPEPV